MLQRSSHLRLTWPSVEAPVVSSWPCALPQAFAFVAEYVAWRVGGDAGGLTAHLNRKLKGAEGASVGAALFVRARGGGI